MEFFANNIPLSISLPFMVVMPIPVYFVARLARKGAMVSDALEKPNTIFFAVILFYLAYLTYVFASCFGGAFAEPALPPRILVLSTIPLLGFLMLVVFNLPVTRTILHNIPLSNLVKVHIFRLMGSFFIILYFFDALPLVFAMIAGIGDLVTAITSIYVAKAIEKKKKYAFSLTYIWNTFGLLDILATSATAFILTKLAMETGALGVDILATFPFCFIPAFAPPTIIFLHLITYRKLIHVSKT